jgi:hypothetical protein
LAVIPNIEKVSQKMGSLRELPDTNHDISSEASTVDCPKVCGKPKGDMIKVTGNG